MFSLQYFVFLGILLLLISDVAELTFCIRRR